MPVVSEMGGMYFIIRQQYSNKAIYLEGVDKPYFVYIYSNKAIYLEGVD